ncbi:MAG: hypothetical protein L6R37_004984 [Teloschistes peruensis]|nr:MAG: hypothetical protein L6R37_004984 [Teloschistes peruensis]
MEMYPVSNNDPVPSLPTVGTDASQPPNTSIWQLLSHQALSNANTGWKAGKTKAEHRQILKDRAREARLRRQNKQALRAPKTQKPREKRTRSKRAPALDAIVKIQGRRPGALAADQAGRVEKFNARRAGAVAKAKETARAKGLERAINAINTLDLNTLVKDQQSEPPKQLLMHQSYAMIFFPRATYALRAFQNLQLYYRNPGKVSTFLSDCDRREMMILEKEEDRLRSIVRERGTAEAALEYQDEKIAESEELVILRQEFAAADRAEMHDTQWFQEGYTARQRRKDAVTAQDLEAYRHDPSTAERLDKKRQGRLDEALECGRTDLNAMGLEQKRRAKLRKQYEKRWENGATLENSDLGFEHGTETQTSWVQTSGSPGKSVC